MAKGIGDGLNRFSQFPFDPVERVAWYACNGTIDYSSDCLAKKDLLKPLPVGVAQSMTSHQDL